MTPQTRRSSARCADSGIGWIEMNLWKDREVRRAALIAALLTVAVSCVMFAFSPWAALIAFCACTALCATFAVFTARRYRRIAELSESLDRILHGADSVEIRDAAEGELSILSSEVRKMTVRLREQADYLSRDRVRMSDALADISHQLRTPLTSMNLTVSLLSKSDLTAEERTRLMFELKQRLTRIDWLVETLLKLSKIDAGTVAFRRDTVRAADLLRAALAPLEVAIELRGQVLSVTVGDETFTGDLAWSAEAVGNLLKNCSEHTPAGGEISVTVRETALFCEILIHDSGVGFAKEEIPHLFDRFYRGSNASPESVGIGLSLARTVIAAQNGTLSASNAPCGGALFTVRFYKGVV